MPSRFLTLGIVVFWLGSMAWLFVRDIWPNIRPGKRPPYTIDLASEADNRRVTRWTVYRNGIRVGHADTSILHRPFNDTYELRTKVRFERFRSKLLLMDLEFQ